MKITAEEAALVEAFRHLPEHRRQEILEILTRLLDTQLRGSDSCR